MTVATRFVYGFEDGSREMRALLGGNLEDLRGQGGIDKLASVLLPRPR